MVLPLFTSICRNVKHPNLVLRRISFLRHLVPRSVLLDKSKHKIIYEFPYIIPMSYTIRTKFWVPSLMTATVPFCLFFDELRYIALGVLAWNFTLLLAYIHCAAVHQMSKFANNTIGKVYVNKENASNDIIISSVNTSGSRIDRYHKPSDIIICDISTKLSYSMGFIKLYVNNTDLIYQLNVINCKIHDWENCASLFGDKYISQKREEKTVTTSGKY